MNDSRSAIQTAPGAVLPNRSAMRSMPLAGLLAWLVPGAGHWYLGHRTRAVILFVTTTVTFWTGIAVGGVHSTVHPSQNGAWLAAQLCMGPQSLGALAAGGYVRKHHAGDIAYQAFWPADNLSVVYTGICGLLNLLIIIDAIARADDSAASSVDAGIRARGGP